MQGLGYGSIRELGLLRHRVRRLYGVGRLSRAGMDEISHKINELDALLEKYNDENEEEETDATDETVKQR